MRRFKKVRGGGGIYARLCLLLGNDINSNLNEIGKEILLMEITKTKSMLRRVIDEHLLTLKSVDELELEKLESLRMILEILDGLYKN